MEPNTINTLSDDELRRQWRMKMPQDIETISSWIEKCGLNRGNFDRWLRGTHSMGIKARGCVIAFLEDREPPKDISVYALDNKIPICKYYIMGNCKRGDNCQKKHENGDEKYANHIEKIRKRLLTADYKNVYFLDYENMPNLPPALFKENSAIIIFNSTNGPKLPLITIDTFIINSYTTSSQAVDLTIAMEISLLDYLMNKDVHFHIVTGDYFSVEVTAKLRCFKRNVTIIREPDLIKYKPLNVDAKPFVPKGNIIEFADLDINLFT